MEKISARFPMIGKIFRETNCVRQLRQFLTILFGGDNLDNPGRLFTGAGGIVPGARGMWMGCGRGEKDKQDKGGQDCGRGAGGRENGGEAEAYRGRCPAISSRETSRDSPSSSFGQARRASTKVRRRLRLVLRAGGIGSSGASGTRITRKGYDPYSSGTGTLTRFRRGRAMVSMVGMAAGSPVDFDPHCSTFPPPSSLKSRSDE